MGTGKGLHIQMFSIHGLLRGKNMELGHDADTGGQIKYVVELCNALAQNEQIKQVDLFTRLIRDKSCSGDYSLPLEQINKKFRIIRIQCGGRKYIRKELLWPFLDEFVDKTIKFIQQEKKVPDIVHGHYADAGYVSRELARFFGIPFVYTGHSLGKSKKIQLLNDGMDINDINKKLKIDHRIDIEEDILQFVNLIITSTNQEIEGQYSLYRNRTLPTYQVIPPGIDIEKFHPYYHDILFNNGEKEEALFANASVTRELERFFQYPDKPIILVLCRPDKKKNIQGLIKAYGEDYELQAMANLAVFAGIRKDIALKEDNERDVLTQMLLLLDKYNLYGKMAIPKKHNFEHEVPELYRIAAKKKGVFVNSALTEPFGLTILESLACGLPIVATHDGGPRDIISNCQSGILVNPKDTRAIAQAIKNILAHQDLWDEYSKNGIMNTRKFYTWENHVKTYTTAIDRLCQEYDSSNIQVRKPSRSIGYRLSDLNHILITDIDNTLLGGNEKELGALINLLEKNRNHLGFGVATGRGLESAKKILKAHDIMTPDIIISCVGSQISYGDTFYQDKGWETHISKNWKPGPMAACLKRINFIQPQENSSQSPYKLSYYMEPGKDRLARIHHVLTQHRYLYTLIYSQDKHLDLLPYRASKGKAIRYIGYKWGIPLKNFLVCGDSGNDEEMLKGDPCAVIVGNHSPELASLKPSKNIYFAEQFFAGGICEGISHYNFIHHAKGEI
ncbi:MAG: HAD-IIB family hydrolase [Desulfobacteraceae bacterium]|nr:HAD-IIB family hydrolase [Desulfobacteraceae bacterium]